MTLYIYIDAIVIMTVLLFSVSHSGRFAVLVWLTQADEPYYNILVLKTSTGTSTSTNTSISAKN